MLFTDHFALASNFSRNADDAFGFNTVGGIIITGRVPGSLYIDDFSAGESVLGHIMPIGHRDSLVNLGDSTTDLMTAAPVDGQGEAGPSDADAGVAPAALALPQLKAEAFSAGDHGQDAGVSIALTVTDYDAMTGAHDLPVFGLTPLDLPHTVIAAAQAGVDNATMSIGGGRTYESLSFLIIDTPFAYGDEHLPANLRPTINDLLGFSTDSSEDDNWVMPVRSWVLN